MFGYKYNINKTFHKDQHNMLVRWDIIQRLLRNEIHHNHTVTYLTGPWQEAEPLRGPHSVWQATHKDPSVYSRIALQHKHKVV